MKRKILALLLAGAMLGGTLAFAGCDAIAPIGGNPSAENPGTENPSTENPTTGNEWLKDDDNHWHTEADKALHTVASGVCTVCKKEVTHTVGLEYTLKSVVARSADSSAGK